MGIGAKCTCGQANRAWIPRLGPAVLAELGQRRKVATLIVFYAYDDQNVTLLSIQESTFGNN